jgi:ribosome maturation factor RimP
MNSGRSHVLRELLEPVVKSLDCELWGLEYHSAGRRRGLLRVYIEKSAGVALQDCERVSRQVSSVLDVEDPIQGEYTLEVSSPGMDRPLYTCAQYRQYSGEQVQIKLRLPFNGRKQFTGLLTGVENDEIKLMVADEEYSFPIETIEKAKVVPRFESSSKPNSKQKKERTLSGKKDAKRG